MTDIAYNTSCCAMFGAQGNENDNQQTLVRQAGSSPTSLEKCARKGREQQNCSIKPRLEAVNARGAMLELLRLLLPLLLHLQMAASATNMCSQGRQGVLRS